MNSPVILVTGVKGFVGRHLLPVLAGKGFKIIALVRSADNTQNSEAVNYIATSDADWKEQVKASKPEIVIHLASFLSSADDEKTIDSLIDSNISFGTHLLNALSGSGVKCFINTGSFAEYMNNSTQPDPAYLYSATKTAFKSILAYYGPIYKMKVIHLIPYTIYGGVDTKKKLIDFIYDSITATEPVNMSPGGQVLDFTHVDDVVNCFVAAIENYNKIESGFLELHVGTGVGHTPRELASLIEKATSKKTNINWGGLNYRPRDTMQATARNSGHKTLGWSPKITLAEGVSKYVNARRQILN